MMPNKYLFKDITYHTNKLCYFIFIALLLLTPLKSSAQQQQGGSIKMELQEIREEINKIKIESEKKTATLQKKIDELENKLLTYKDEKQLSKTSARMSDKQKISYLARTSNTPIGTYLGVMNPDISIVVDSNAYFTRDKNRPDRNKVRVREGEIALQGNLYPGIRGDFYVAFEQEYEEDGSVNGEVDLEAGTIRFMDLPFDLNAQIGRMFVEFGDMNKVHQHHRATIDQPLVLEHFFKKHSWIDDGIQISVLLPNPFDLYWKLDGNYLNGRSLKSREDEDLGELGKSEKIDYDPIPFNKDVVMLHTFINFPFEDNSTDLNVSYSLAWQNEGDIKLHSTGFKFKYRFPYKRRTITWKNEVLLYDNSKLKIETLGGYSQLKLQWNVYWDFGTRLDWSEFTNKARGHSKSASVFTTYNFTETTYARIQYRYRQERNSKKFNELFLQMVWGIGPHSHRLEN